MKKKEAKARIKINKLLERAGWRFEDSVDGRANIDLEQLTKLNAAGDDFEHTQNGFIDYLLCDGKQRPICVVEAKRESLHPLTGKEQARDYADSKGCRFVLLSNGVSHYLWDVQQSDPKPITEFPTLLSLQGRVNYNPRPEELAEQVVSADYLSNKKTLRDYQLDAIHAVQQAAKGGKKRFLLEMATGTGKTTVAAALCKLFLQTGNASRILFLVDRIELETQAEKNFREMFEGIYFVRKYKEGIWRDGHIVVSTVQSLLAGDKYRTDFSPTDFELVISDEAHRSLGGKAREVFEYFSGYKLGLTATPKDYLRGTDGKVLPTNNPTAWEQRNLRDTYRTFGCEGGTPTFRYGLNSGVQDRFLIKPRVLDARTDIITALLSEDSYAVKVATTDEEEAETILYDAKDFEKKIINDDTNRVLCETIIKHGLRDPITNEFGKTLVFCVRQSHAAKITNLLNQCARKMHDYIESDFAVQITSSVANAQEYAKDFASNRLRGRSQYAAETHPDYDTSKARVCVTVGMMTTGYDCPDLLNIALLRPIFSPSDFIQMKGRGTRTHTYRYQETGEQAEKTRFLLLDFFANYEYFEHDFVYDKQLPLPSLLTDSDAPSTADATVTEQQRVYDQSSDAIRSEALITIGDEGMKIDRALSLHEQFEQVIRESKTIQQINEQQGVAGVLEFVEAHVFNQPTEHWTAAKLRASYQRQHQPNHTLSLPEMLLMSLQLINRFKSRAERIEEEFQKFRDIQKIDIPLEQNEQGLSLKRFFENYLSDPQFRKIIDSKEYGRLDAGYAAFSTDDLHQVGNLVVDIRDITKYINKYLQLEIIEFSWNEVA